MSDSEEDEELIKEAIRQNQREKYGADTKEGIQLCIECHDLRKVYCEPFTKCDNSNCSRYICGTCLLNKQGEFCDYCHKCGKCSEEKLLDCHNCGVMRCPKADKFCGIRKCPKCGLGECDECDGGGDECPDCGEELPSWSI